MMEKFFELVLPAYLIAILSKVTIFYLSEIVQKYINLISSRDRLSLFPCRNKLSLLFFLQYKLGFFPILPSFLVEKVKLKVAALKNEKISKIQLKRVEVLQKCFAVSVLFLLNSNWPFKPLTTNQNGRYSSKHILNLYLKLKTTGFNKADSCQFLLLPQVGYQR